MALNFASQASIPIPYDSQFVSLQSQFTPTSPKLTIKINTNLKTFPQQNCFSLPNPAAVITCSSSPRKLIRDPRLDKHIVKQNKIRFVLKLKTLLLSKPKHFIHIEILYKCRAYLSLPRPRSLISMIKRYPTIFELFTVPTPPNPFLATGPLTHLCVRLTPAAFSLAKREINLKKRMADSLAIKLQKLLMLASPHHRILLSKLVHLGPDLGLPVNFRSRLCNDHPDKFKVVDTSYGRALQLVSWDSNLARVFPPIDQVKPLDLIVDRPLKFKQLKLRKGLNLKRSHQDYLIKFSELPEVCPYTTHVGDLAKESIESEKRACALVREVLSMTIEKRTLVDHLTHFRNDFYLPNKLRGMIVRHPELFYVSVKGQRDSVFLVEGYDDKAALLEKDELSAVKYELMKLVREGKRIRREKRKEYIKNDGKRFDVQNLETRVVADEDFDDDSDDDDDDGLDDLFELDDDGLDGDDGDGDDDDESDESMEWLEKEEFWVDGGSGPW